MKKIGILISLLMIVLTFTCCIENKIKITSLAGKWEGTLLIENEIQTITATMSKGDNNYRGYLNIDSGLNTEDMYYFCYCQNSSVTLQSEDFKTKFTGMVHMDDEETPVQITGEFGDLSWSLMKKE